MTRVLMLLTLLVAGVSAAETPVAVRRLALLVGVNDGGAERVKLRYATTDAQAFSKVLGELGGVTPADRVLLLDTGRTGLMDGFARVKSLAEAARASGAQRVEMLLYYSGHSDDEGLLLQGDRVDYGELRRALAALPVDVRIAVLDSCASGAFARRKGGTPRPAFMVDSGSQVKGQAILTSSSADEVSQESDRLGGSFFTHHLVSGLRGAADVTRDGRVTLNEAYQFAFHETLARTERTQGGAQHPAYDIELAGTGDLVMTDLRATSAGLVLADGLEGRFFVRDEAGVLVVELLKTPGRPTELGLAPGRYQVRRELNGAVSEASFVLTEGQRTPLAPTHFGSVLREATVSRGGEAPVLTAGAPVAAVSAAGPGRRLVPFNAGLLPGVSINAVAAQGGPVENRAAVGVMNDGTALAGGAAVALVSNAYDEEVRGLAMAAGLNVAGGSVRGAQLATALNVAREDLNGLQMTAGVNVAGGNVRVGQFAAGVNVAGGAVAGTQMSAGVNVAGGDFLGVQATAGVNVARGGFRGFQGSAGMNWVDGAMSGLQATAGYNRAESVKGLQLALLNVSGDVTGAQVGLINVGKVVSGAQVGLINVAEEVRGVPLGLLTFEEKGQLHLEFWASDVQLTNVAVKFGGKYVYTTLLAGIGPDDRLDRYTLGLGLGVHLPLGPRFWLDVDTAGSTVHTVRQPFRGENVLAQGRAMFGFQVAKRFAVFGGPTYNAYFAFSDSDRRKMTTLPVRQNKLSEEVTVQHWPGMQFGLRI
ncbi:caspase family protein [Hyalangium rubrum]|uniref:Caspase family protein n=1 Tax=Hyalangium rubrum TaxID=3103134 RepID=A0ABU5HBN4_9BACT|nr:caspase family protein [Hyalangium sp. s54d21]MDY7230217.1 caspase family protein [Hyalangium sp. s54d21]